MANEIGAKSFLILRGLPDKPGEALEVFDRRGEDYQGYRHIGKRSAQVEMETMAVAADAAAADIEVEDQKDLAGSTVTIVDSFGVSHANCKIVNVLPRSKMVIYEGGQKVMIRTRWLIQQNDPDI